MELAKQRPSIPRLSFLRELADESRSFWSPARLRFALAFVAGMLLLEILVAAVFYAGASGHFGRAPMVVHQVASFFGLNAAWAKAIFRATETIDVPGYHSIERNLRDPFALTSNVIRDVGGIAVIWLLPIFTAIAYTCGATPVLEPGRGRTVVLRFLISLGPLAFFALVLTAASSVVHTVWAYLASPPSDPTIYPAQRIVMAPWGDAAYDLLFTSQWVLTPFLVIPTVAVAFGRDRQQCLSACLGTSLFLIPLLGIVAASHYPGGIGAIPPFLMTHGDTLIKLSLFAIVLPFALWRLRAESPSA